MEAGGEHFCYVQTHRTQLAAGNPSGRCEWHYRCCFALELPTLYEDIKASATCLHLAGCSDCPCRWSPRMARCVCLSTLSTRE